MKKSRRGGTLIELLVALVLLDLALLSLAAVGAVTARRIGDAGRRSRAAIAASNRIERLSAIPCAAAVGGGGGSIEPGVVETWAGQRTATSVELSDSIEFQARPGERLVVRNRVSCR